MKPPRLLLAICNMLSITPFPTVFRAKNISESACRVYTSMHLRPTYSEQLAANCPEIMIRRRTAKMRNVRINEDGHIVVKNLSAYWIPKIKVERAIHGTVYTVTGSYEGTELPDLKLTLILL